MDFTALEAHAVARIGASTPDGWRLRRLERVDWVGAMYEVEDPVGHLGSLWTLHGPLARSPDTTLAFHASARVTGAVDHGDAVRFLAGGALDEGVPYVLLTPCAGETVAELVARRPGRVPPAEALRIVGDALAVVTAAHSIGVVHGALGPEQIVITEDGIVKVLGFGTGPILAQAWRMLAQSPPLASAAFTAPELTADATARPSVAADLWCLGAVLFHLLTGEFVHPATTASAQLEALGRAPPRTLAEVGVLAPPSLEALVAQGLAQAPASRFPSAGAFRSAVVQTMRQPAVVALGPLRSSTPPLAAPSPPPERAACPDPPPREAATTPPGGDRTVVAPAGQPSKAFRRRDERAATIPAPQPGADPAAGAVGAGAVGEGAVAAGTDGARAGEALALAWRFGSTWTARLLGEAVTLDLGLDDVAPDRRAPDARELALRVMPWGLVGTDGSEWEAQGLLLERVHALYASGLRRIVLPVELHPALTVALVNLPSLTEGEGQTAERLAQLAAELPGTLELAAAAAAGEATEDARFAGECRQIIALAAFDARAQLEECWQAAHRRRPREAPGAWRAGVAADFAPWLDELPWIKDPKRRAALAQRLANDSAAVDDWAELTRSVDAPERGPTAEFRRASPAARAGVARALVALLAPETTATEGRGTGPRSRDGAAASLVEALARCGTEGATAIDLRFVEAMLIVGGEPLCESRAGHLAASRLGGWLLERGVEELSLATTLTERAARELAVRLGSAAARNGPEVPAGSPVAGVSIKTRRGELGGTSQRAPAEQLLTRYAGCLVKLRQAFEGPATEARRSREIYRGIARRIGDDVLGSRSPALALALTAALRDPAARALHTAILAAAAARAAGAERAATTRVALAAFDLAGVRAQGPRSARGGDLVGALARWAVAASPNDPLGRAALVIAARTAELVVNPPTPGRLASLAPRSGAPSSRPSGASAELLGAVIHLFDQLCPDAGGPPARTPLESLRAVAVDGRWGHHTVGALVGALGALPVGSVVELDDGAWSVVESPPNHPQEIDRPAVRLITDAAGTALPVAIRRDLGTAAAAPGRVVRLVPSNCCRFNLAFAIAD